MRAHTGEKPYKCDLCEKSFTCSKQLKVHVRTHTGERPYECDICGKTFSYNHVLKMHKKSHMGERLYKCNLCDNFFNSRKALDTHIKEHEGGNCSSMSSTASTTGSPKQPKRQTQKEIKRISNDPMISHPSSTKHSNLNTSPAACGSIDNVTRGENSSSPFNDLNQEDDRMSSLSSEIAGSPSGYYSDDSGRGTSPINDCSPSHSPNAVGFSPIPSYIGNNISSNSLTLNHSSLNLNTSLNSSNSSKNFNNFSKSEECVEGSSLDLILKQLQNTNNSNNPQLQQIQQDILYRLKVEEIKKQKEKIFYESVRKVLKSLIPVDQLERFGYPNASVDQILISTLEGMSVQPCFEPSLRPMDRIKVNLRLLLEACVTDQNLWVTFGWRGKSIEEIINEFIKYC